MTKARCPSDRLPTGSMDPAMLAGFGRVSVSRPLAIAALVACAVCGGPAGAQVSVQIDVPGLVQRAPPPPRYEPAPAFRSGQLWVPGHWAWERDRYDWRAGYWLEERRDQRYQPGHWVQARGGWTWQEERWARRDRDRDRDNDRDADRWREREDHRGGDHCPPGQAKKGRC